MIQDLFPQKFSNLYKCKAVSNNSVIFCFNGDTVLCGDEAKLCFPLYKDISSSNCEYIYLFEIDTVDFFLADSQKIKTAMEYSFKSINVFRSVKPKYFAFAGITAYHLEQFYRDNKYCGRCGSVTNHDANERALFCFKCSNIIYPKITPAVIVGIVNGNKLLMTKYANSDYKKFSLVAGFAEIGESAEETVKREVFEEVGLKIKNIRYYKSQPWGFSSSLLLGYFADLDGEADIKIDKNELSEAVWVERDDISTEADDFSLTNEMICKFKNNDI